MINLSGIHHVAIICSNYEISKRFYTELLGFEVVKETFRESRESYKLDLRVSANVFIELFSFPNVPPRPSYPEACGLRHLAFNCVDLEASILHLKNNGIAVEDIRFDANTNRRFTFFSDPDGLPLELYEGE
jgi:glyoxylase I family protein